MIKKINKYITKHNQHKNILIISIKQKILIKVEYLVYQKLKQNKWIIYKKHIIKIKITIKNVKKDLIHYTHLLIDILFI